MTRISITLAIVLSFILPNISYSHSGGLNSQGCHAGSQPYHCHRSSSEMVRTGDGRNRLRCDLGSRSLECVGQSPSLHVLSYQRLLTMHCPSLSAGFADGRLGPSTVAALVRFQAAYGLTPDGIFGPRTKVALQGPVTGTCK